MNISQTKGWQNETKGLQLIEYSQRFCDRAGNNVFFVPISPILINPENGKKAVQVTSWL